VSARQTTDILHFLEALSDGSFDDRIPEAVPSGLPVGGAASMDSAAGEE